MTTPVLIFQFGEDEAFTLAKLNVNFQALVSAINALAAEQVLQFGPASASAQYLGIGGGTLLGQLAAPSILVGPDGGTKYPVVTTQGATFQGDVEAPAMSVGSPTPFPVVTTNDAATLTTPGIVLQAEAVADPYTPAGATYSQAQAQNIIDLLTELLENLRTAGTLETP